MENNTDVKIFSFHYKPGKKINNDPTYIHVWSGKNQSLVDSILTGDDSGQNISDKNLYYSELSGIYWAWKNNTADIWGSCHYRRFFTVHPLPLRYKIKRFLYFLIRIKSKRHGLVYSKNQEFWKDKIITKAQVVELLKQYDAVMPIRRKLSYSVEEHYRRYHDINDLFLLRDIVSDYTPEYQESFNKMMKQNRLYANNMFILKNEKFQELMNWLFDILFEFERQISLSNYKGYQQRIMGFLSERLITCWFIHQQLNVKEVELVYFKKLKKLHVK